jgi:FdhD protein
VAVEEPLEIRIETRSIAVVMRTPGQDEELAAGFVLSEGILRQRSALKAIQRHPRNKLGNVVDVFLADGLKLDLERFTRHVFASSSCGICGVATIEAVRRQFPKIVDRTPVRAATIQGLGAKLADAQEGFTATGGVHAAALFTSEGRLLVLREDIGRHNAVDKVIGRLFLDGVLPVPGGVLWVSGRASFEILQKALAARIPVIASVGAPSSLAIELAQANGQTLVGFLRDGRFNVYAGPRRLRK